MMKQFMQANRLAEALFCDRCQPSGCHAAKVRTSGLTIEVEILCRCSRRYGRGTGLQ
jgi:hypothetical protein